MVKCSRCLTNPAITRIPYAKLNLCKTCFNSFILKRVKETVEKYRMFNLDDKVAVAVSGGKDSAVLLHSLKQVYPKVEFSVFHINLGIKEYSENCLKKVKALTKNLDMEFYVYNLKTEKGLSIDDFEKTRFKRKICSVCGTIKRQVFNEVSEKLGADVLATGHNLDDMVEIMFSNFLAGDFEQLVKLKPVIPPFHPKLVKKVKPLFRIPEKELSLYALINNLPVREVECPHVKGSRMIKRKKLLEIFSEENPNFKFQLLSVFLKKLIPILDEKFKQQKSFTVCEICGFPALTPICGSCKKVLEVKTILSKV